MRNIVVAALIAAASVCSPAILVTATSALAVDCTDPADPGNRPGGYCKLLSPGTSLSTPVSSGIDCSYYYKFLEGDARQYIPRNLGESVLVADHIPEVCWPSQAE